MQIEESIPKRNSKLAMRTRSTERYDVGSEAETTELFASDSANPQSPRVNSPAGGGATEIFSSNPKTCTRERAIGSSAPSAAQAATCNNTSATASKYFTCRKTQQRLSLFCFVSIDGATDYPGFSAVANAFSGTTRHCRCRPGRRTHSASLARGLVSTRPRPRRNAL
jgi:hypothetical protein